jgi:hypothetical protein
MTKEIQKEAWGGYFNDLSRDMAEWQTTVRVISDGGAQILSEGLPFAGLTYDQKSHRHSIELTVGNGAQNHQLHNIYEPIRVAFEAAGEKGGTLDIVDARGTSTLITFEKPKSVLMRRASESIQQVH